MPARTVPRVHTQRRSGSGRLRSSPPSDGFFSPPACMRDAGECSPMFMPFQEAFCGRSRPLVHLAIASKSIGHVCTRVPSRARRTPPLRGLLCRHRRHRPKSPARSSAAKSRRRAQPLALPHNEGITQSAIVCASSGRPNRTPGGSLSLWFARLEERPLTRVFTSFIPLANATPRAFADFSFLSSRYASVWPAAVCQKGGWESWWIARCTPQPILVVLVSSDRGRIAELAVDAPPGSC
ncbi:hypothetical protein C8Q77DRAFT_262267 [Trametes polyzona]|nr:hypothetical protein C8Q77DRAFT_262267 [Trametes polyzona]